MPLLAERPEEKEERLRGLADMLKIFLNSECRALIDKAIVEGTAVNIDYSSMEKFGKAGIELGTALMESPVEFFAAAGEATKEYADHLPLRFYNLPESQRINVRDLRAKHLAKFISVEGTIRRASEVRPEIVETVWECSACGALIVKERIGNFIGKPFQCSRPDCGSRFGFREKDKKMIDVRALTIEEPFELTEGDRPSQVAILLEEDLTVPAFRRMTDPGNRIRVTGVLKEIPRPSKEHNVKMDIYMKANHVEATEVGWENLEITEDDEKAIIKLAADPGIYKKLVRSLAPSIYGMDEIKESIIMQLFGGVPMKMKDRTHIRGNIHILLIGDPGSGKSQLLKLTPKIVPRGKYVSGKGVTGAGLTASVVKDELFMGGWVLEAGAMVLANKGILAIDEFEKVDPDDQVALHEALEQGSVSIAKASIVATLPAQTSVLAGGNPKFGRFDQFKSIADQITVPDTLLSRFDLKFALKDIPDEKADKALVEHVLKTREDENFTLPEIDPNLIKKYIAYSKNTCEPQTTKESGDLMKEFYLKMRKMSEGGNMPVAITLRQFEALIRLSQASAKIQLSPIVRREDALRAIRLMEYSMKQLGFDAERGTFDVDKLEGGTSFSERSKINTLIDIIAELSRTKKSIPVKEIEEAAANQKIEKRDVDHLIEKMKREGTLFEPSVGHVQKV